MDTAAIIASLPDTNFSLHIGQDSLAIWCPTCEDCIFENDGDRYYQNFESGVPLDVLNVAAQLHVDRHHAKPQNAPSRPAAATPAPEATDGADAPHKPSDAAFSVDYGNNVKCVHGKTLQRDHCTGCEVVEETPHYFNGVEVRDRNTRKLTARCVECGLPAGNATHKPER